MIEDKYYKYNGYFIEFYDTADSVFFMDIFDSTFYMCRRNEIENSILSDEEKFECRYESSEFKKNNANTDNKYVIMKPLIIRNPSIYINLKASTIALFALILDIEVTKGIANFILVATGVNMRLIVKLDETIGEKCALLEVYKKEDHMAKLDFFDNICGRDCINNDMTCKYRVNGMCTINQEQVKGILDNLCNKNVLTRKYEFYKYNF